MYTVSLLLFFAQLVQACLKIFDFSLALFHPTHVHGIIRVDVVLELHNFLLQRFNVTLSIALKIDFFVMGHMENLNT